MTERDYINTTNLVRIRLAMGVLRDTYAMTNLNYDDVVMASRALSRIEQRLTKIVKTVEPAIKKASQE